VESRLEITIEWGDCDPAEIVFYPNYFRWFDAGTRHLIEAAGLAYSVLRARYGVIGLPLVEASSQFRSAIRFGDRIVIVSGIERWGTRSLTVAHRVLRGEALCVEGRETRIWAVGDAEAPGGFAARAIPEEVKRALPALPA